MLKSKKLDENTVLYSHEDTNEPIAEVSRKKSAYGSSSTYTTKWHPVTKELYPTGTNSLTLGVFPEKKSSGDAKGQLEHRYMQLVNGDENPDPLKVVDTGESVTKNIPGHEGITFKKYNVHHPKNDSVIAHLFINKNSHDSAVTDYGSRHNPYYAHVEYVGDAPTDEQHNIMNKRNNSFDPISLVKKVKHFTELQEKEPSFIGSHRQGDAGIYHYNTKLPPEKAGKAFVEHLKTLHGYKDHKFEELAPNFYSGIGPKPDNDYSKQPYSFVDARQAGRVIHVDASLANKESYRSEPHSSIID